MAAFESKQFSWREGYSYKVSADTVGAVLEKIEHEKGKVTPKDFLDYSRDEGSETHSMFEWDDSVAAEKYRLGQSTKIINQIEVKIVRQEDPNRTTTISGFVNVEPHGIRNNASFVSIEKAKEDYSLWNTVMKNAMRELTAFKNKYSKFKEFEGVIAEIDNLEKLEKLA